MTECVSVTPPRPLSAFTVRELTGRRRALEQTLDTLPATDPGHRRFSQALEDVLAEEQGRARMARAR
jgi:hypothetical protein